MTRGKAPVRRCTWRDCALPAAARVRFELPNLLAGSERDYCQAHTAQVCAAPGVWVRRWLGRRRATQPALPGLPDAAPAGRSGGRGSKGVMP